MINAVVKQEVWLIISNVIIVLVTDGVIDSEGLLDIAELGAEVHRALIVSRDVAYPHQFALPLSNQLCQIILQQNARKLRIPVYSVNEEGYVRQILLEGVLVFVREFVVVLLVEGLLAAPSNLFH